MIGVQRYLSSILRYPASSFVTLWLGVCLLDDRLGALLGVFDVVSLEELQDIIGEQETYEMITQVTLATIVGVGIGVGVGVGVTFCCPSLVRMSVYKFYLHGIQFGLLLAVLCIFAHHHTYQDDQAVVHESPEGNASSI